MQSLKYYSDLVSSHAAEDNWEGVAYCLEQIMKLGFDVNKSALNFIMKTLKSSSNLPSKKRPLEAYRAVIRAHIRTGELAKLRALLSDASLKRIPVRTWCLQRNIASICAIAKTDAELIELLERYLRNGKVDKSLATRTREEYKSAMIDCNRVDGTAEAATYVALDTLSSTTLGLEDGEEASIDFETESFEHLDCSYISTPPSRGPLFITFPEAILDTVVNAGVVGSPHAHYESDIGAQQKPESFSSPLWIHVAPHAGKEHIWSSSTLPSAYWAASEMATWAEAASATDEHQPKVILSF